MKNQDVTFIRKNGRIIPIRQKSGSRYKKNNRKPQYESRSKKAKTGAQIGAAITGGATAAATAPLALGLSTMSTQGDKIKAGPKMKALRYGGALALASGWGAYGAIPGAILGGAIGAAMPRKKKNKKNN